MNNTIRGGAIFLALITTSVAAQQPRYTVKPIITSNAGAFKDLNTTRRNGKTVAEKDGKAISYIEATTTLRDIDDDNAKLIKISGRFLLCFEGNWKNGKKEGQFNVYVMDSLNHQHRYKIWEQQYKNNRLNGTWRLYTLRGTLASLQTYENDSLKGILREYGIHGEILDEKEFLGSAREYVEHHFYPNGKMKKTITIRHGVRDGIAREYYEDGQVMEEVNFKGDKFDGIRKYFYPNGQLWIEEINKNGLSWEVVSNFTESGERRNAGTLREGNGTIIYYHEDGSVREVSTIVNGVEQ